MCSIPPNYCQHGENATYWPWGAVADTSTSHLCVMRAQDSVRQEKRVFTLQLKYAFRTKLILSLPAVPFRFDLTQIHYNRKNTTERELKMRSFNLDGM